MRRWARNFFQASREIQYFIIITIIFSFILLATTVYSYVRLNYVRQTIIEKTDIM